MQKISTHNVSLISDTGKIRWQINRCLAFAKSSTRMRHSPGMSQSPQKPIFHVSIWRHHEIILEGEWFLGTIATEEDALTCFDLHSHRPHTYLVQTSIFWRGRFSDSGGWFSFGDGLKAPIASLKGNVFHPVVPSAITIFHFGSLFPNRKSCER